MDVQAGHPAYPRVTIEYCTQCKWMLRATYYAQELLSTFESSIAEVSLRPAKSGTFKIHITSKPADHPPPNATSSPPPQTSEPAPSKRTLLTAGEVEEDEEGPPLFPRDSRQSVSSRRPSALPPHTENPEVHGSSPITEATNEAVVTEDPSGSNEAPLFPASSPPSGAATKHRRRTSAIVHMDNPELKEVLNQTVTKTLWDRRQDGGFPETKELKRRVRDVIEPGRNLGHVDRDAKTGSHERGTCGEPCKECE